MIHLACLELLLKTMYEDDPGFVNSINSASAHWPS
jgi:hypothetical protein